MLFSLLLGLFLLILCETNMVGFKKVFWNVILFESYPKKE